MTNFNMKALVACLIAANANGIYASESLDSITATASAASTTASVATQTDPDLRLEQLQKDLARAQGAAEYFKAESARDKTYADNLFQQFSALHMENDALEQKLEAEEEARDRYQKVFTKLKAELSELRAKFALAGIPSSATTTSSKD